MVHVQSFSFRAFMRNFETWERIRYTRIKGLSFWGTTSAFPDALRSGKRGAGVELMMGLVPRKERISKHFQPISFLLFDALFSPLSSC